MRLGIRKVFSTDLFRRADVNSCADGPNVRRRGGLVGGDCRAVGSEARCGDGIFEGIPASTFTASGGIRNVPHRWSQRGARAKDRRAAARSP